MEKIFKLKDKRELIIRPVKKSDYEAVQIYVAKIAEETFFTLQYEGMPKKEKESFEKGIQNAWIYVAVDGDEVVGLVSAGIAKPNHPWLKYTASFGVHMLNAYQGNGLGTYFMSILEDWAKEKGLHRIEGAVRSTNIKGISLYLKCGYEIEGMQKDNVLINDKWHSEYIIAKILD